MNRKRGFTLIELLVVMAIIAILASIVVPNVQRYIVRARLTKAVAEINGVELALTALLTDAGRGNFNQILNPLLVDKYRDPGVNPHLTLPVAPIMDNFSSAWGVDSDMAKFYQVVNLYTAFAYELLRNGREILVQSPDLAAMANRQVLTQLGTTYMDAGLDPWGLEYRVYFGPWRGGRDQQPVIFRKFTVDASQGSGQLGTVPSDPYITTPFDFGDVIFEGATWPEKMGFPADRTKNFYIWSYGSNSQSSQMLYIRAIGGADPYAPLRSNKRDLYPTSEEEGLGGGDDINNWDSANMWQRFYM